MRKKCKFDRIRGCEDIYCKTFSRRYRRRLSGRFDDVAHRTRIKFAFLLNLLRWRNGPRGRGFDSSPNQFFCFKTHSSEK